MDKRLEIKQGPFNPTVESLQHFECPGWFRDAKFGMWSHWGPQSVPMYGDWYARHMYCEGTPQYMYHWRKYGHPSMFGYKDIVKLWKAENFDPAELMDLFVEAGARYFVSLAVHHDNFDNFDSVNNPWNSTKVGPMKDICRLWQAEAKKHGLPFGLSEHLAASYTWFTSPYDQDKTGPYAGVPYDGADPANRSYYRDNNNEFLTEDVSSWYTKNPRYHDDWFNRMKDIVDQFQPDILYSDGHEIPFGDVGYSIIAHLYNSSAALHGGKNEAVYNFKKLRDVYASLDSIEYVGVLGMERGLFDKPLTRPWQDDTTLGDWFYDVRAVYKKAEDVADTLVDVVSKNGNLLLNVPQKPDGTLDEETRHTLKKLSRWIKQNGDGIYGTRPYKAYKEGNTDIPSGVCREERATWLPTDFRFTQKPDTVFAFMMRAGTEERAVINALGRVHEREITSVQVSGRPVDFEQKDGALFVKLPGGLDKTIPVCVKAVFAR